jgi:hypothetical protein
MSITTTVPLYVSPEAAARVAELGFQREFEQLIERARTTIQGVRRIEVQLEPPYDTHDNDQVVIWIRIADDQLDIFSEEEYSRWTCENFSPDVRWYISTVLTVAGPD